MSGDDEVGYKRPPKWTQFEPGKSGNPAGRPRRAKSHMAALASTQDDILRSTLAKEVVVTEGSRSRTATMQEVVLQKQINLAVKGNVYAQRDVLRRARELEERDRVRAQAEAENEAAVFDYVIRWRRERGQAWRAAEAQGREPADPWPHPDDILIDRSAGTWRVRGPAKTSDVSFYAGVRADRDVVLVRAVLALRARRPSVAFATAYAMLHMAFDALLPLRWQCDIDAWENHARFLIGLRLPLLRAILAKCEREAASIFRPALSREDQREVYHDTNRMMKPLLERMGYRSLKQFEVAYAAMGKDMP